MDSSASAVLGVSVAVASHPGRVRSENQDRISRAETPFGELYILADGVGGYGGGGAAAQAVVEAFASHLNASAKEPLPKALRDAARSISAELRRRPTPEGSLGAMSSTVVLAIVQGSHVTIGHVGDSRAYLAANNRLDLLTTDDSLVERMVAKGLLSRDEARTHPDSNVLTQAIGQSADVGMNIMELEVRAGESLLLCSDGLWAYAEHAEMQAIALTPNLSLEGQADALLNLALQGGGGDNISLQLLRFAPLPALLKPPLRLFGQRLSVAAPLALAAAGLAAGAAYLTARNVMVPLHVTEAGLRVSGIDTAVALPDALGRPTSVILITSPNAALPDWAGRLKALPQVRTESRPGTGSCLALREERATLMHTPDTKFAALQIADQVALSASDRIESSAQTLAACGEGELFVLPSKPGPLSDK
jgi:PPM family protein phosphatase